MTDQEKINWVYSQLEDEESKFIFEKRIQFNHTGNYNLIWDIVDRYVPELADHKWSPDIVKRLIHSFERSGKKTVIFGAGHNGKILAEMIAEDESGLECFCDNNPDKWGRKINGWITVISPDELFAKGPLDDYVVIISPLTQSYCDEIYNLLVNRGFPKENIYRFMDYYFTEELEEKQYFDKVVILEADEVFVDGGCYRFDTSERFLKRMKNKGLGCKKIYAFEPDESNFGICRQRAKDLKAENAELIQAGLWNSDTHLTFATLGNASSRLYKFTSLDSKGITLQEGDDDIAEVRVVSLDTYISEKVTFIKMDIEGAELEALKGAEHILLRDKPKLAVCIYHNKEDLYEIPHYLKTLVPEYKLYIRHYSNYTSETVLYAVCEGV